MNYNQKIENLLREYGAWLRDRAYQKEKLLKEKKKIRKEKLDKLNSLNYD